jgi:hypothetical protein
MDIYTFSILISIAIYALVGNYAGRKVKHLEDYFVGGRQAPTLLIVGTLVASVLSTNAFLGETGFSYASQGGAYILWPAIWVTGYVWGALYFGRYLRRSRALTVAEFFGWRFDSQPVQAAAGVTIVLGLGSGGGQTLIGTIWPELYGVLHLGAIRSMIASVSAVGSALSPVSLGWLIDAGIDMRGIALGCMFYVLAAIGLIFLALSKAMAPSEGEVG